MELLYNHKQEKVDRKHPLVSQCDIRLFSDENTITFINVFYLEYLRMGTKNKLTFEHGLSYQKDTGDFTVTYIINNSKNNKNVLYKTTTKIKENNFDLLLEFTQRGFYTGEKRFNFWGVKFRYANTAMFKLVAQELNIDISTKSYAKDSAYMNPLYDLLVDHHLSKKNIKAHDCVYWDILYVYPKKKWLKLNENKFIPAILDQYGIKSRLLIAALSTRKNETKKINLKSLRFLCNLFGDNYVDYFHQFDWQSIVREDIKTSKQYTCKTDSEKTAIAKSLATYSELDQLVASDGILNIILKLFQLREFLTPYGLDLKIKAKSCTDLNSLYETWDLHKRYYKIGYRLKYTLPQEMIDDIERPIVIADKVYTPSLILTEDQFKIEGMIMKNCMAKQFAVGIIYIHVALSNNKKRINAQYRKGKVNQFRGKTNKDISAEFEAPLEVLNKRMMKYADINPKREKYDFIID